MKKILLLLGVLCLITSCSMDEDTLKFHVEFVPVVTVEMPEVMIAGQAYEIKVKYRRPTDCYYFDGFYHESTQEAQIIAVQTLVIEDAECVPLADFEPDEATFSFTCSPQYAGSSYTFKFYQGDDAQGNQLFMEVPVQVE